MALVVFVGIGVAADNSELQRAGGYDQTPDERKLRLQEVLALSVQVTQVGDGLWILVWAS